MLSDAASEPSAFPGRSFSCLLMSPGPASLPTSRKPGSPAVGPSAFSVMVIRHFLGHQPHPILARFDAPRPTPPPTKLGQAAAPITARPPTKPRATSQDRRSFIRWPLSITQQLRSITSRSVTTNPVLGRRDFRKHQLHLFSGIPCLTCLGPGCRQVQDGQQCQRQRQHQRQQQAAGGGQGQRPGGGAARGHALPFRSGASPGKFALAIHSPPPQHPCFL